ncbi:hypothetical protein PFISCL1PPCAC_22807 [Pristionchus fissidentatus]|uniref:Uncharacterized protein n=1 Tax=Pristionchus fissidentatus TaxID=1538716 RepID=A0AAV5WLQ7_9BILA|nr:hypothetical protein PFISCL1PPCAC_22807 [Pristionchus fissidentatus]
MELCYSQQPSFNWNLHWVSSALRHYSSDDESEVRRSSVGSTASSSASSIADSLTSSGCSSSEDLAAECRPQSLLPPLTPPRKESLEDSTPKQSLSARYLQERGRDLIFTPRAHDSDNESSMDASSYEASYDLRDAAAAYNASKPYGDEVMATPPAATAAAPEVTAAPTVKVEEEEEHVEAAAAVACCLSQDQQEEKDTPSAHTSDLTPQVCDDERQDVSIVEIDEEEIMEDEAAPEARQQTKPEVHVQLDQAQYIAEPQMRRQPPYDDDSDSEVDTDDDGEIEDIANRHLRLCFNDMNSPQMAGDGNPIRHSIIHLAMEEDRPALLEAMSETYSFVFEDVDDAARASTSGSVAGGIIKPAHAERRAKMKRIVIESEATGVYTYLDEQSAETEEQWREGAAVTIQDYHSMVATAAAEAEAAYMRSVDELTRWNASIAASERAGSSSSSSDPISDLNSRHLVYST